MHDFQHCVLQLGKQKQQKTGLVSGTISFLEKVEEVNSCLKQVSESEEMYLGKSLKKI